MGSQRQAYPKVIMTSTAQRDSQYLCLAFSGTLDEEAEHQPLLSFWIAEDVNLMW